MKIHVVTPIVTERSFIEPLEPVVRPDVELEHSSLEHGPSSMESYFDEALALPGTLAQVQAAERDEASAALINCMGDPGLSAAREMSQMLVLGPAQTSMHVASLLAQSFSIITTMHAVVPMFHDLASVYGMTGKLRSVRSVDIPVLALDEGTGLGEALLQESIRAIEDDGAHALILGCTGMIGVTEGLRKGLAAAGWADILVIDPMETTLKVAEALADIGLAQSKRSYPTPPSRVAKGFEYLTVTSGGQE